MAVSSEGEVVSELTWRSERNHSVELVPALRQLMAQAKVRMEEVGAVFVARGPGGFSALRVGISVAKSIAAARAIPMVAVGTLDVEAQPYLGLGVPVCAVVGAGRTKFYAAVYLEGQPAGAGSAERYSVETHEGMAALVPKDSLLCGEAALPVADVLRDKFGVEVLAAGSPPPTRRPGVLAMLGNYRLQAGDTDDPETLQPIYMRGSQFETAQRNIKTR